MPGKLPLEILEEIFAYINCPLVAQDFFEVVLVGDKSVGTHAEFLRFVVNDGYYIGERKLRYMTRSDPEDGVFVYQFAQRPLFARLARRRSRTGVRAIPLGEFVKLRLSDEVFKHLPERRIP